MVAILFSCSDEPLSFSTNQDVDINQFDVGDLDISQDDADWGLLYDGDEYQYWDMTYFEYLNGADVSPTIKKLATRPISSCALLLFSWHDGVC